MRSVCSLRRRSSDHGTEPRSWPPRMPWGIAISISFAIVLESCGGGSSGRSDTIQPSQSTTALAVRGCYGKDSSASGFDRIVATGFTIVDRGAFKDDLDSLPPGVQGSVWLGAYDNNTCTWEKSDDWIRSHVGAIAGHPAIADYYLADEPHVWSCPGAPDQIKARSELVKSIDPKPPTFVVIQPHSPGNPFTPYVGTVDVIGGERFPCSHDNGCVMSKIDETIGLLDAANVPRYWVLIQAFADSFYRTPTADELRQEFQHWRASRMEGYLVFSWNFGTDNIERHPDLIDVLASENRS
jgi:hypothetical protein